MSIVSGVLVSTPFEDSRATEGESYSTAGYVRGGEGGIDQVAQIRGH